MTGTDRLAPQIDRKRLTETLSALVRLRSVTGSENAAQEWMAERLTALGGDVDVWRVDPAELKLQAGYPGARVDNPRLNVVGTFQGSGGPTLILNGHIDTVTPGDEQAWMHAPFSAAVVDDRLYGRGAADMNGRTNFWRRTADAVFPTGPWHKGGNYGTDVNFPIPFAETNNPAAGAGSCIDRNP